WIVVTGADVGAGGAPALVLRGVRLADHRFADVHLCDGLITEVTTPASGTGRSAQALDLRGYLLLPAPAEPHAHLDKAFAWTSIASTGDPAEVSGRSRDQVAGAPLTAGAPPDQPLDLGSAVATWLRHRPTMTRADLLDRAGRAVLAYLAHGATAIRTHVDVADDIGLRGLSALVEVRGRFAAACTIQVVAFANSPLCGGAGAGNRQLLREAMSAGADVVGGCPSVDPDPAGCISTCLDIAAEHHAPVDLHVDETLDPQPCTLALLAQAVMRSGFPHPVVASHCVSLGAMPVDQAATIVDMVAAARIAVTCLPQTNLYLQGRAHQTAPPRGLTALRLLRSAGVLVAAGGDNLQDPFNCLGRADPLETAALLVLAGHQTPDTAYAAVSGTAREVLGLPSVEITPGAPAELVAVRAESVRQAIAEATVDRLVIHAGQVVARTTATRELPHHLLDLEGVPE
ncbi:MAG TPA: amidohydrolase family protein, partial [Micromonosporaceae bacterium]